MAEDALPRSEERLSPLALGRNRRVGFVVICGRDRRDAREHFCLSKTARCRCPRLDKTTYWGGVKSQSALPYSSSPVPLPVTTSCNHGPPNVHLTVPRHFVAYLQPAQNHRASIPRLRRHLILSRVFFRLGVSRRLKVESRFSLSANFSHPILLFDHLGQVEGRTQGEESRCDLSSSHRWKAAGQL